MHKGFGWVSGLELGDFSSDCRFGILNLLSDHRLIARS